jgi:hypothetical protein
MKKLLIFDLNGIFLVRERGVTEHKPSFTIGNFKCFVRPGVRKFLKWVHHHFDVAVWSSTMPHNTIPIVRHIWGKKMKDLKFIFSQRQCTHIGTMDDGKPIFLKELKYVWEMFPWYDETNTVLIDDSPYKVARNPPQTSIHPEPLTFETRHRPIDLREHLSHLNSL